MGSHIQNAQPCWYCKNFVDGCSWSANGIPVDGWDAEPTVMGANSNNVVHSYKINHCQEFVSDGSDNDISWKRDHTGDVYAIKNDGFNTEALYKFIFEKMHMKPTPFAKMCHLSTDSIQRYLNGSRIPSVKSLNKMADGCGMTYEKFMKELSNLKT